MTKLKPKTTLEVNKHTTLDKSRANELLANLLTIQFEITVTHPIKPRIVVNMP